MEEHDSLVLPILAVGSLQLSIGFLNIYSLDYDRSRFHHSLEYLKNLRCLSFVVVILCFQFPFCQFFCCCACLKSSLLLIHTHFARKDSKFAFITTDQNSLETKQFKEECFHQQCLKLFDYVSMAISQTSNIVPFTACHYNLNYVVFCLENTIASFECYGHYSRAKDL